MRNPVPDKEEFKRRLAELQKQEKQRHEEYKYCAHVQDCAPEHLQDPDLIHRFVFTHTLDPRDTSINVGLCWTRDSRGTDNYKQVFCSKDLIDMGLMGGGTQLAPLYLKRLQSGDKYINEEQTPFDSLCENLRPEFREKLNTVFPEYVTAKEYMSYLYAVLHNEPYCKKYLNFLQRDDPRVPLIRDYSVFMELAALGEQLIELHLMNNYPLDFYRAERKINLDDIPDDLLFINRPRGYLVRDKCRLELAEGFYVPHVTPEIYDYKVGSYKVLQKLLKEYAKPDQCCKVPRFKAQKVKDWYLHILDVIFVIENSLEIEKLINEYDIPALPQYDVRAPLPEVTQPAVPAAPQSKPAAPQSLFD